jgi:hypothetical protein
VVAAGDDARLGQFEEARLDDPVRAAFRQPPGELVQVVVRRRVAAPVRDEEDSRVFVTGRHRQSSGGSGSGLRDEQVVMGF